MSAVATPSAPSVSSAPAAPAAPAPSSQPSAPQTAAAPKSDAALDAAFDAAMSGAGAEGVAKAQAAVRSGQKPPTTPSQATATQQTQAVPSPEPKNLTEYFGNLSDADKQLLARYKVDPAKFDPASFLANLRDRAAAQDRAFSELDKIKKGKPATPPATPAATQAQQATPPAPQQQTQTPPQTPPVQSSAMSDALKVFEPLTAALKDADVDKASELLPGAIREFVEKALEARGKELIEPLTKELSAQKERQVQGAANAFQRAANQAWFASELPENVKTDKAAFEKVLRKAATLAKSEYAVAGSLEHYPPKAAVNDAIRLLNLTPNPEATVRQRIVESQTRALTGAPDRGNAPAAGKLPTREELLDAAADAALSGKGLNGVMNAYRGGR